MKRRHFIKAGMAGMIATPVLAAEPVQTQKHQTSDHAITWSRKIPVRYEADIAVIGGGIAGVSAACAAAKSGASVILVERFAVTGGVLTTGGVANFSGQMAQQGEVFEQIVKHLKTWNALGYGKDSVFHYEILAIILQEMLLRRKVKLLLHTRFIDAKVNDSGRIKACLVCGKSGIEAIQAKQFIDCTGEADLARYAGFETLKGGPSGYQLPMSMMYFVRHVDPEHAQAHLPQGWFDPVTSQKELPMTSPWPDGPGGTALKIKIPMFDATDTQSLTQAEIAARRRMMEVLDYFQRQQKKAWILDHCSPIIGIREGSRIVGDYILKVDDLRAGRAFEDGVARGTYQLDGHKPDDDKRTYILPKDELKVPPYQIPLRSLIARDAKNLMMAGRCVSADQLALSSARVSTTGSMMGQAAGITTALCVDNKCDPRDVDPETVKRIVKDRGGYLDV
ncbi:MAG: FAD-dependent oxidoreductase [candidate division KSB1 bacterium]|nr:FAD-dependent oxidoreductase [candidate division KSB1 bacterium]